MRILTGRPWLIAKIKGEKGTSDITGVVRFFKHSGGVLVEADVIGLPKNSSGFHGFHIHGGENCEAAGSHLNMTNAMHPQHSGDLPPLLSNNGRAYSVVLTNRFSLRDIQGRTVVIHKNADDFASQPAGNAGDRIACGVIEKM